MADMTKPKPRAKVPPKVDVTDWRERIPADILAAAEAEGPLDVDSHSETPEQAAERRRLQHEAMTADYRARVPVMYQDANLAQVDDAARLAILDWIEREGSTLFLAGPVGTGKTHAAYGTLAYLLAMKLTVEAVTLSDLLASLRPDGDHRQAERARKAQVLLLDDFGAAKPSEWAVEQVVALLDERLREGRRQIVTTNAPYEALEAAWEGRAMDRLRYRWAVVTMTGESRRKAAW